MPEPSDGAGRPLQVKERAWIAAVGQHACLLCITGALRRSAILTALRGSRVIDALGSLCTTTTCSPLRCRVMSLRSHHRRLQEAIYYAGCCKRTSQNSSSTQLVNKGKMKAGDSPLRFTYASEGFLDRPIPLEPGATNRLLDQSA